MALRMLSRSRRVAAAAAALVFFSAAGTDLFAARTVRAEDGSLAAAGSQAIESVGVLGASQASLGFSGRIEAPKIELNGWDYLYLELRKSGIEEHELVPLFTDSRMPARETLYFSLNPREPRQLYRKHNSKAARKHAMSFYRDNAELFKRAEAKYGVPQSVILSILQIETGCGGNTGASRVFYQLARLAAASEPGNIEKNLDRYPQSDRARVNSQVAARAAYLHDTFLPHVAGAIRLSEKLKIHPLELRGSAAGAVGMGQFLPGNVMSLGVDGNGDSFVDPYSGADSVMSVANFLKHHGWKEKGMTTRDKRAVIWHYNRSDAYIDTVLAMAQALGREIAGKKPSATFQTASGPKIKKSPAPAAQPKRRTKGSI